MKHSATDAQITALYRGVLVPWERLYVAVEENWKVNTLRGSMPSFAIEIVSVELAQVENKLNELIEQGTKNFFVFVRGVSQGRDLFRHLRNAIAHAGVTRHQEPPELIAVLRFKSPNSSKKAMAMAGQLEENHLSTLITAMSAMAAEARERHEA